LRTAPAFAENDTCTVESINADSATVRWPAPSFAQFYYIDIGTDASLNSTSNVYTVTGLSPVTNYTFIITVYGKGGIEGNSVECRGKTGLLLTFSIWPITFYISDRKVKSCVYEQILILLFVLICEYLCSKLKLTREKFIKKSDTNYRHLLKVATKSKV